MRQEVEGGVTEGTGQLIGWLSAWSKYHSEQRGASSCQLE